MFTKQLREMERQAEVTTTVLEKQVMNYLTKIGFNDVDISMSRMYINYVQKPGWKDAMGLIDPNEITEIRSLIKKYKK